MAKPQCSRLAHSSHPRAISAQDAAAGFGEQLAGGCLQACQAQSRLVRRHWQAEFTQESRRDEETDSAGVGPCTRTAQVCGGSGKLTAKSSRSRGWSPEVELTMTKPASRQDGLPVVEHESWTPPIRLLNRKPPVGTAKHGKNPQSHDGRGMYGCKPSVRNARIADVCDLFLGSRRRSAQVHCTVVGARGRRLSMDGEAFPGPVLSSERMLRLKRDRPSSGRWGKTVPLACLMLPGGEKPGQFGKVLAAPVLSVQIAPIDRRRVDADAGEPAVPWNGRTRQGINTHNDAAVPPSAVEVETKDGRPALLLHATFPCRLGARQFRFADG
ncbi:predicted protein [Chaetomium globosum CBS 148.51]|uniref:Uncharacterized protein n=1 Tax=Chaetomium globosum (strain ATCC 6205 / CBS 148.51 / DSM 1962 / NBRC 6347 / NRRL 1970) TaxID=306901 RepID=Q2GSF0_CHAGB|nr:uncharacterized protein CHGG_09104 [Chaetomium globosum CBS 148.51]EAQ85090.1 predicted protein [Chaetomium globosum CBS 148.51]